MVDYEALSRKYRPPYAAVPLSEAHRQRFTDTTQIPLTFPRDLWERFEDATRFWGTTPEAYLQDVLVRQTTLWLRQEEILRQLVRENRPPTYAEQALLRMS